jgi:hypothetical protein
MPAIYVWSGGKIMQLVFPEAAPPSTDGGWVWKEVGAGRSTTNGFGLFTGFTVGGGAVRWGRLKHPVLLPYLGHETAVDSPWLAGVLTSVLEGCFDVCAFGELPTPGAGYRWVLDGHCVMQWETGRPDPADSRLVRAQETPEIDV